MKTFLVRGVPASIQQDGWWMDGLIHCRPPNPPDTPSKANRNRMERPLSLVALIALSDVLLWGVVPGLCDDQSGPYAPYAADWREWGFRDWRTLRSLAALNAEIPEWAAQPSTQGEQTSPTY